MVVDGQVVAALKQEKRQLEHRCISTRDRLRKVTEEMGFLLELNKSLETDKVLWEEHLQVGNRWMGGWVGHEGFFKRHD